MEPQRGFVLHDRTGVDEKRAARRASSSPSRWTRWSRCWPTRTGDAALLPGLRGLGAQAAGEELAAGAWLFTEAAAGSGRWAARTRQLWDDTLRGMGVDPAMLLSPAGGVN